MTKRLFALLTALLLLACCLGGCAQKAPETKSTPASPAGEAGQNPVATIEVRDFGTITVELYPDMAPNTVANFISLANSGFYEGVIFHRIIAGFMIQGGDPTGTGAGGPGYTIKGEFAANGFAQNTLKHTRGVISMARTQIPDSAGSQFFIMHADANYLDGQYAAFGKVTDGLDVVDAIATVKTGAGDRPVEDVVIDKVTVETYGVEYALEKLD